MSAADQTVKYVAEVAPVQEVSLLGAADLDFWREQLREEELFPAEVGGKAQLWLSAAGFRFLGIPSRELSVSLCVSHEEKGGTVDGLYLMQAFNASRAFAFIERTMFATPYAHAGVRVNAGQSATMELAAGGVLALRAEMSSPAAPSKREPLRSGDECWEGPIFLPTRKGRNAGRLVFFARLAGLTEVYAFSPSEDVVTLHSVERFPVLGRLRESQLTPLEWSIRRGATHARSRTVAREAPAARAVLRRG